MKYVRKLWVEEKGQGLLEYGLLVALVVVVAIAVIIIFEIPFITLYTNVITSFNKMPLS